MAFLSLPDHIKRGDLCGIFFDHVCDHVAQHFADSQTDAAGRF